MSDPSGPLPDSDLRLRVKTATSPVTKLMPCFAYHEPRPFPTTVRHQPYESPVSIDFVVSGLVEVE